MKIQFPHTIANPAGEILIFYELVKESDGDKIVGENFVLPQNGPPMHVHWLQDEGFTVIKGKVGYRIQGQPDQFAVAGESVVFKRGVPHCFWNAGDEMLNCKAWVKPANSFVYFISAVFEAQKKTGSGRPALFDAAYLLTRYKSEYDMLEIPGPVKKLVFPVLCAIGKLLGKYKHFKDAPAAIK